MFLIGIEELQNRFSVSSLSHILLMYISLHCKYMHIRCLSALNGDAMEQIKAELEHA